MCKAGLPLDIDGQTTSKLEAIGFVDVTESTTRLPINPADNEDWPVNLAIWWNKAFTNAIDAMSEAPLTRIGGMPMDEAVKLTAAAKRQACTLSTHAYCKL
jgi:hypothetical protein